ncbi:MAG: hypothetical protein WB947_08775 [Thermoplasmata archaeon]
MLPARNDAVRRFRLVQLASLAVKLGVLFALLLFLAIYFGGH